MPDDPVQSTRRVLETSERMAEMLFGVIMFLPLRGIAMIIIGLTLMALTKALGG